MRIIHLADIAKQVGRHGVVVLPRRDLLNHDVGQFETPGRHRQQPGRGYAGDRAGNHDGEDAPAAVLAVDPHRSGVLHDHDRPIRRFAAVPIDDLAHAALLEPQKRCKQLNGAVEILRVLAKY